MQVIVGNLDDSLLAMFIEQYSSMFGAVWALEVENADVQIWMGGRYDNDAGFLPPPAPEPQPEPLPEPQPEPES